MAVISSPAEMLASDVVFIDPRGTQPLRAEAFGVEHLERYARQLARASVIDPAPRGRQPVLRRFEDNGRFLARVYRELSASARRLEPLSPDAEWLLDNYYIIDNVVREVKQDLPRSYYEELPVLAEGPARGYPRVHALALGMIAHTDSGLDEVEIVRFVRAYQTVSALTIGELWAVPTMLRLGLVENLRRLAAHLLETRADRDCAFAWARQQLERPATVSTLIVGPTRLSDACVVGMLQALRDQGKAGPATEWLEDWLSRQGLNPREILRREHQRQAANQVSIGNAVTTLRLLGALDWSQFFEESSLVEALLRQDPARAYPRQDFATRDRYRRNLERLARAANLPEDEVARRVLERAGGQQDRRRRHVGYYLIDEGRRDFEAELGCRPRLADRLGEGILRHAHKVYFGSLLTLTALVVWGISALAGAGLSWATLLLVAAVLLPAGEIAVGLVHFLVTRLLPPRVLPKLDFKEGLPADCATFVVIPGMLTRPESAVQLTERLELHYLANPDPQLRFALLTDFADALEPTRPEDDALVGAALERVRALNERYAAGGPDRFFLFHRKRLWNPSQARWMGWERKRGKLLEFNRLLRGDRSTSYTVTSAEPARVPHVRYVLTLDADTNLPRDTARRLIGTLAHPLNQAEFDPQKRRVVRGYGVLQPRVSFLYQTGLRSWFARIFAGSAGIDPYSAAVSDVYQDLFGEGSYTGKGLYDVDAFEKATGPAFPDNHILSHDLIESNFARCGLVTDIELLDDFPARYHAYARREHRWVRGDWQLLPWLGRTVPSANPPGRVRNPLPLLARWKVLDNLRRSLMPPALVLLFVLGWTVLPGSPWLWTGLGLGVLALPLLLQLAGGLWEVCRGASPRAVYRSLCEGVPPTAGQVLLLTTYLADQARLMVHAISATLYRLWVSRRRLLEWETAAAAEARLGGGLRSFVVTMWPAVALAAAAGALVAYVNPAALPAAAPLLALWFLSPLVAYWVSKPLAPRVTPLGAEDRRTLRRVARKTWGFFETFIGPRDHWLPPDNYQEAPREEVAHRTSPTNKGLLLLSTLSAHDLGYLGLPSLATRLENTLATMDKLERHHGHFLNWYDTRSLAPLDPAYVSTVDSGNLLGCLLTLRQGLFDRLKESFPRRAVLDGLADTLGLVSEEVAHLEPAQAVGLRKVIDEFQAELSRPVPAGLLAWDDRLGRLGVHAGLVMGALEKLEAPAPAELKRWADRLVVQVREMLAELAELAPWIDSLRQATEKVKAAGLTDEQLGRWAELYRLLDEPFPVGAWASRRGQLLAALEGWPGDWAARLAEGVRSSTAEAVAGRIEGVAARAEVMAAEMDFRFLYNAERNLFAVGFNLPLGRLDNAHYDLLASEACLASFLAIARGEVPRKHWFHLGRPATRAAGHEGLLSWGGTMFEYLMPRLVLPHFPGTLIDAMQVTAVARQREYGRQQGVPWGISESAFNVLDAAQNYQYQSFGVPGLGIKRGLSQDLVVAPYATALAAAVDPTAACRNLAALRELGACGPHGYYEAVDFTPVRLPRGEKRHVVRSYMAHHQGMTLVALANAVLGDPMPRRLRAEPRVRATELLLQERVPLDAPHMQPHPDEDVPRQDTTVSEPVSRRITTPQTPSPRTHLLSNGQYTVMVTAAGGGFSACRGLDVTRWREDRTLDAHGQFFYIRDLESGKYHSACFQPVRSQPDVFETVYSTDKAEFRRVDGEVETHVELTVSPEKHVEVRRITLTNHGTRARTLEVTSYAEVVLAPHGTDLAHPAFHKLFLETEWLPTRAAILCRRRPRAADQRPVFAVHVMATEKPGTEPPQFETDRAKFLGRRRTPAAPAALDPGARLSGTAGPVLDPVLSLRQTVRVEPGTAVVVAFSTALADTREEGLALADEFHTLHAVARAFELAWAHSLVQRRHLGLSAEEVHLFQRLAGHLFFAGPALRAPPALLAANNQGQAGLWRQGLSGDLPLVVVRVAEPPDLPLARILLSAHSYWRAKELRVDLVLLNENPASYFEDVHEQLQALVRQSDAHTLVDRPGGVFVRKASHMPDADRILLLAAARLVLAGEHGTLAQQVDAIERRQALPPNLRPARRSADGEDRRDQPGSPPQDELAFANGTGGFAPGGREYVVVPGAVPPAPWINVIANPQLGFLVSDSGSGYTWFGNSQQNRLTPWSNDPVSDPPGEALYLRDEETGVFWSPTPLPVSGAAPTRVRHAPGQTVFEQRRDGLEQTLRLFVAPDAPVKFLSLRVVNVGRRPRTLSATFFAEWVLGMTRDQSALHVVTELDDGGAILAKNAFSPDFAAAVAFVDVLRRPRTLTGDRTEFLGRNGAHADPAALRRVELSGRVGAGLDPCAAVQTRFDLAPGAETTVVFVLGQAADRAAARALLGRYHKPADAEAALARTAGFWDELLSTVRVKTPDPALDLLLNNWLLPQVLACRVWGRSAFYQSGGAYGFRDQLQDVMALVHAAPAEARAHLLRAAARQFEEGDVQHWWHPPAGRGVRTHFSDDYLWLPFVVHHYVASTGDRAVLDESVPFIKAPLLGADQEEVYGQPSVSPHSASLYEHCVRALEYGWRLGEHGLPLMGIGDWNDGMNKVGAGGKGESVWVAWFQLTCLRQFAELADARRDDHAQLWRDRADQLRAAVEDTAWDGRWYRRAYFDDGTPLGSADNDECKIDSLAQTWAVISGAADPERARQALEAVMEMLVRKDHQLVLLFTPPFDRGPLQPGYIKGYVPGIRENGGQYTHAAIWVVQALALLGQGDRAFEVFDLLNPVRHATTPKEVALYKVEPYVAAADVYGRPPHTGRGGWTWYTGSASWLYRVALESILGFRRRGARLEIDPRIPTSWNGFEIDYRYGRSHYRIRVVNAKESAPRAGTRVWLDGQVQEGPGVPLTDDGKSHEVLIELGEKLA